MHKGVKIKSKVLVKSKFHCSTEEEIQSLESDGKEEYILDQDTDPTL